MENLSKTIKRCSHNSDLQSFSHIYFSPSGENGFFTVTAVNNSTNEYVKLGKRFTECNLESIYRPVISNCGFCEDNTTFFFQGFFMIEALNESMVISNAKKLDVDEDQ